MRHATLLRARFDLRRLGLRAALCPPRSPRSGGRSRSRPPPSPTTRARQHADVRPDGHDGRQLGVGRHARTILPGSNRFYKNAPGGQTRPSPAFFPLFPRWSSRRTSPRRATPARACAPLVLGGFPEGSPISLGDASAPLPGTFSMSWGDLVNDAPGTYEIARLTFPQGVVPNVINILDTGPTGNYSNTSQVNPASTVEIPTSPSPRPASALRRQSRRCAPCGAAGGVGASAADSPNAEHAGFPFCARIGSLLGCTDAPGHVGGARHLLA